MSALDGPRGEPEARAWTPPRRFGAVNWRGAWSLYRRDMIRYLRFAPEGVGGALVFSLLLMSVIALARPEGESFADQRTALQFLAPGIVGYALFLNAFQNASFPVIYDKLEGMIGDVLMAPLTPMEILGAYLASALSGALLTGIAVLAAVSLFVELPLALPWLSLIFALLGGLLFALVGFLTGLWAPKWDRFSMVETFLVLPLGLLSGTFFTLDGLPALGQRLLLVNPVFYAIDGVRSGFTGVAQASVWLGLALLAGLVLLLWLLSWRLLAAGWRVKS